MLTFDLLCASDRDLVGLWRDDAAQLAGSGVRHFWLRRVAHRKRYASSINSRTTTQGGIVITTMDNKCKIVLKLHVVLI